MTFVDQGEFEAMKMLSGPRAPCCEKHHFRAKLLNRLRDIIVERSCLDKNEIKKE